VERDYTDISTKHAQVKYQGKNLSENRHLSNEGQGRKTGHAKGRALTEGEGKRRK
jgi:hypothetical protein